MQINISELSAMFGDKKTKELTEGSKNAFFHNVPEIFGMYNIVRNWGEPKEMRPDIKGDIIYRICVSEVQEGMLWHVLTFLNEKDAGTVAGWLKDNDFYY